jgi:hypothetical protein
MYPATRCVQVMQIVPVSPKIDGRPFVSAGWMFHTYSGIPALAMSPHPLANCVALNAAKTSLAEMISSARCWFLESSSSRTFDRTSLRPWIPPSLLR